MGDFVGRLSDFVLRTFSGGLFENPCCDRYVANSNPGFRRKKTQFQQDHHLRETSALLGSYATTTAPMAGVEVRSGEVLPLTVEQVGRSSRV